MKCDSLGTNDSARSTAPKPGFTSFKNVLPIRYPRRWHRDMLIQLVLDPAVTIIESSSIDCGQSDFCVTVRTATDALRLIATRDMDGICEPLPDGSIRVPRSNVLRQPRAGTARMVWAARGRPVPAGDRLQLLMAIESHVEGVAVGSLLAASPRSPAAQAEAVFALACEGLVTIDLTRPFSPSTRVRSTAIAEPSRGLGLAVLL